MQKVNFDDRDNEEEKNCEIDLNQINVLTYEDAQLSMVRLPWSLWILTILCFGMGSLLIGNTITKGVFVYHGNIWWEYFVAVVLYIIGIIIFLCGKVEIVCFKKEKGILTHNKWILCYKWKGNNYLLSDILEVSLQKEGQKNEFQDTIHYKVYLSFIQTLPLRVLETKDKSRALEKVREIREFLGLSPDFHIRDISSQ